MFHSLEFGPKVKHFHVILFGAEFFVSLFENLTNVWKMSSNVIKKARAFYSSMMSRAENAKSRA